MSKNKTKNMNEQEFADYVQKKFTELEDTVIAQGIILGAISNASREFDSHLRDMIVQSISNLRTDFICSSELSQKVLDKYIAALNHGEPPDLTVV